MGEANKEEQENKVRSLEFLIRMEKRKSFPQDNWPTILPLKRSALD